MRRLLASCVSASSICALALLVGCGTGDPPGGANDAGTGASGGTTGGSGSGGVSSGGKAALGGSAGTGAAAGSGGAGGAMAGGTGGGAGSGAAGTASGGGGVSNGGAGGSSGEAAGSSAVAGGGMAGDVALGGAAGQAMGGLGGMAGAAGGAGGAAGSGGPPACPSGALFCSGFEDATLPAGATYLSSNDNNDWTLGTQLDKTVFNAGAQSLEILEISSYAQREVVVPAAQNFWFRAYLRTDVAIGGPMGKDHNLFFEAAWQGGDKGVEIVEEDCMLGMNIEDTRYGSNGIKNQPGCPSGGGGTQLAADTWHCIEGHFDGVAGNAEIFVGGTQVMALTGEAGAKRNYTTLRFGYRHYHERQRLVWYDDVATAAARIGCQ
jgi:hypothetical protein